MAKKKILLQLDGDPHASVFDAVVAVDAGVDHLFQNGGVEPSEVRGLVHGAMFTRGPRDLLSTAIFVGGSNVAAGEELLRQVKDCFFGPFRVSVLLDANGANTTAAAAVLAAAQHVALSETTAVVLGGTGPVGQRAARLLARQGAKVRVASRTLERAAEVCQAIAGRVSEASLTAFRTSSPHEIAAVLEGAQVVIAAGAAGTLLLPADIRRGAGQIKVAIDLNAVPPLGIAEIDVADKAVPRDGQFCYGAIGIGGTKMKLHRAAIETLFTANNLTLDAEEVFAIGQALAR